MDRNLSAVQIVIIVVESLSARRAWIEIRLVSMSDAWHRSLSARRAWIEIRVRSHPGKPNAVALRKESVDRNFDAMQVIVVIMSRSPQGERG